MSWAGIMAWSNEDLASFSRREPWLPLDNHYEWHNVEHRRNTSVSAVANMALHKKQQVSAGAMATSRRHFLFCSWFVGQCDSDLCLWSH